MNRATPGEKGGKLALYDERAVSKLDSKELVRVFTLDFLMADPYRKKRAWKTPMRSFDVMMKGIREWMRRLGQTVSRDSPPIQAPSPRTTTDRRASLLTKARAALTQVEPMAARGWGPAESIARQLGWCAAFATNEPREKQPGPFSMGLIATREFDMYGDRPELASLINEVQRETEDLLQRGA